MPARARATTARGLLWNASSAQLGNYPDKYNVTGGGLLRHRLAQPEGRLPVDQWGPYPRWNTANADLYQVYNGGTPLSVTVLNTPLQTGEYLDANLGIYAQDAWRLNRFTINLGLASTT